MQNACTTGFVSVQSHSCVYSLRSHGLQHTDFPILQCIPEFAQTHVHGDNDATQPSHPLSLPSPPAVNLFQPQGLLQWVRSSHQVAKLLELQLQHQFFQWNSGLISFRIDWFLFFGFFFLISLQFKGLSRLFSSTTVWKHQFFSTQPSLWFNSHICTWLLDSFDHMNLCRQGDVSAF